MFVSVKFHLNNQSKRCTLPNTVDVEDLKKQAIYLFSELQGKTFFLDVSTPSSTQRIHSNMQWIHTVNQVAPGLIHIQISFQPKCEEKPTNKKLISPERKIILPLQNNIKSGEAVSMYGRMQSMDDEDIRWCFDLCGKVENNVILRIEFIKNANHVGWTQCSHVLNNNIELKSDFIGAFPFTPDTAFHLVISFEDNYASIQFSNERCAISKIPLFPFKSSDIDTVVLSSVNGRIICSSLFHSYSLL